MLALEVEGVKTRYGPRPKLTLRASGHEVPWQEFLADDNFIQQERGPLNLPLFQEEEQKILNPVLIAGMTPCGLCTASLTGRFPFYSLEGVEVDDPVITCLLLERISRPKYNESFDKEDYLFLAGFLARGIPVFRFGKELPPPTPRWLTNPRG